jgi:hypothetical protein
MKKQAQIQVTFNWMYVLIAGAVILLFFVGIVFRQKAASEERLAGDVVRILDSIFTAAGVSEKTKNSIDTSGLIDYRLYFQCDNGVSEFGIRDQPARTENALNPVFAPLELQTAQIITWSLPYQLPYKVTDLLFVTSINTQYYVVGNGNGFATEFVEAADFPNIHESSAAEINEVNPGNNFQLRIVDVDGNFIQAGAPVPSNLANLDRLSAVSFQGDQINYYQKNTGGTWTWLNANNPLTLVSLGEERDAAKYAAIFAGDDVTYQCNMQKAYQRLSFINEVYVEKVKELDAHYSTQIPPNAECLGYIKTFSDTLTQAINLHQSSTLLCTSTPATCSDLIGTATNLRTINQNMGRQCITLY